MALLSQMFRSVAITGSTDASTFKWIAGRQGARWADRQVRAALPEATRARARSRPPADPATSLRALGALRRRGVVTDAEFETLRARLGA